MEVYMQTLDQMIDSLSGPRGRAAHHLVERYLAHLMSRKTLVKQVALGTYDVRDALVRYIELDRLADLLVTLSPPTKDEAFHRARSTLGYDREAFDQAWHEIMVLGLLPEDFFAAERAR
jgi:hypothetical protein